MRNFDADVARRQSFGAYFTPSTKDPALAAELLGGVLQLPPHKKWALPEDLTWAEDPFSQRNWAAQLHMLRWLDPLRRVALKGDEDAADLWWRHVKSWIEANRPGRAAHKFAWANMVDGIRALELVLGLPLVPEAGLDLVLDSLEVHGQWLADERHLGHANHALHQHQGLFVIGAALKRPQWRDLAVARLGELLQASYDEEGTNAEGALGYHRNNLVWWTHAMRRLHVEGIALPPAASRLSRGAEALAHSTRPDGLLEMIGDTASTKPTGIDSPYLEYVLSQGSKGLPPEETALVLSGGYVFSRSGWGEFERDFDKELFWSASFGSASRVHGHADGGSITFFADRPWLVDSGKYAYVEDKMADFVKDRVAHNVVTIRDRTYDPDSVVALTKSRLGDDLDDLTFVDTGYSGVTLTRRVIYCKGGDFLFISDVVDAKDDVVADQLWHFDPDVVVKRKGPRLHLEAEGQTAHLVWAGNVPTISSVKGSVQPFQGWTSRTWAEKTPSEVAVATKSGRKFRYLTLVAKPRSGEFSLDSIMSGPDGLMLSITSGSLAFHLHVKGDQSTVSVGGRPAHFATGSAATTSKGPMAALTDLVRGRRVGAPEAASMVQEAAPREVSRITREKVREAGGTLDVRMAVGEVLLERVSALPSRDSCDHGLRATLVDVLGPDLLASAQTEPADLGWQRQPLVRWRPEDPVLQHPRYKLPVLPSSEILASSREAFAKTRIGLHETDGLVMPYAVRGGSTDALVVRFHGAIMRSRTELPIFQGMSSGLRGDHAFLNFQDPTLDLDSRMNLSWFLGHSEVNLFQSIAEIIEATAKKMGVPHVVMLGSSGGGYTALQVAAWLEGAHAIAFNPQVQLAKYYRQAVAKAMHAAYDVPTPEDLPAALRSRASIIDRWAEGTADFSANIVHNSGDAHHNTFHVGPLRDWLAGREDLAAKVEFTEVSLGPGHVSAPMDMQTQFLDRALERLRTGRPGA